MIYTVTLNPALDKEYRVPKLEQNEVLRAKAERTDFGGKGFNVSRMLYALGMESTAVGFVGGEIGRVMDEGLQAMGISTDFVTVADDTRTNVSIVSQLDGQYIKVNEPGPTITDEDMRRLFEKVDGLLAPGDWWVLAGSLPPGAPVDLYARLITRIKQKDGKVILDTSGEALKLGCAAGPYLIKPNVEEAREIIEMPAGKTTDIGKMIARIHAMGANLIILSAGKHQSYLSDGNRLWAGVPPRILEKNPTGAGDAMLAAIVYALALEKPPAEAFAWGIASGSAAASQPGTRMAEKSVVEALIKKVIVKEE